MTQPTPPRFSLASARGAIRFPWTAFFVLVVVAIFGSAGVVFGVVQWIGNDLPQPKELTEFRAPVKTLVYDARGRVLHEFFKENRSQVPIRQIPRHLINATIATEDRSFYQHWGVDLWGVGRAAMRNLVTMRRAEGGSTITQQLARNLFLTHERTVSRKLKEIALAVEIERNYSKNQILEMYFNQIYFGDGAYGVEAAAKTFFNKPLGELTLPECALLSGLPANPALYSPRKHGEAARARRSKVLRNMLATKAISQVEFDHATGAPLGVTPRRYSNDRAPYFVEMVRLYLDERYGSNAVYEAGLRVYTTLDIDLQQAAERSLEKQLSTIESDLKLKHTRASFVVPTAESARASSMTDYLQGGLVALDPRNGYIRALVGGRDWNHSNFNRAVQARRQPGSAFKPFVYTAAMDNGFRPTDVIVDEPVSFPGGDGKAYTPGNYDRTFRGPVTLRYALQMSINIPAIKLLRKVGTSLVASYAKDVFNEMRLGMNSIASITYERLERESSVTYPCEKEGDPGQPTVFIDKFPTPTGRARFVPADIIPADERPDTEFPFVLITGRQLEHWHTGAMTRRASVLDAIEPEATALIHPLDLDALGAKPGDVISVASRRGIVSLYARADDGTPRGAVFIPFCFYEAAANLLTNPALDPVGKIPEFKYCAVKVMKGGELTPVSSYGGGQAMAAV